MTACQNKEMFSQFFGYWDKTCVRLIAAGRVNELTVFVERSRRCEDANTCHTNAECAARHGPMGEDCTEAFDDAGFHEWYLDHA